MTQQSDTLLSRKEELRKRVKSLPLGAFTLEELTSLLNATDPKRDCSEEDFRLIEEKCKQHNV